MRLISSALATENLLEEMIVTAPEVLSDEWMLIGRQENTGFGGRVDLVAIAPDSSLVVIELKRDKTPREVVAQALDHAGWIESLETEAISAMYHRFSGGSDLMTAFAARFGAPLDPEQVNLAHQIIVVASALDQSTERIVKYLSSRNVPINVLTFQVFAFGEEQVLSRTWLIDPADTQIAAAVEKNSGGGSWNGEFYCSFGEGPTRTWEDAVRYGFVSAGGGRWYSRTLDQLHPGDRIWVNIPQQGYVGVGRVLGGATPVKDFCVETAEGSRRILDLPKRAEHMDLAEDDPEKSEYLVSVLWLQTVTVEHAISELGFFGNQNTICKPITPKWRLTVDRLMQVFPRHVG